MAAAPAIGAALVLGLVGVAGSGASAAVFPHVADDGGCGSTTALPAGATPEPSFAALLMSLSLLTPGASAVYYLDGGSDTPMSADTGQSLALPADTNVTLDLDGCFLDVPTPAPGAAAIAVPQGSALTIEDTSTDQTGSLTADGGDTDSNLIGAGAGIGGDGGAGDSGAITILGGAVEAQGGNVLDSNGPLSAGAGAAIGGGGGGTLAGSVGQAGGSAGAVTIDGGSVTANGGSNNIGAGAAAIGGGGGGGATNAGGSPGAGGAGADVMISGGSVTTDPAGLAPLSTDVGVGPGSAGSDASAGTTGAAGAPGSVTVEGGVSGAAPVALGGEFASVLTVDSGVTLDAILETGLTLDATGNVNNGTIDLASQIEGAGTLDNAGSINVSELDGADAGDAVGPGLTVTGNVYDVTYNNDAAMSPNAVTVYAPTFKAGGEQLPMIDGKEGYDASGWETRVKRRSRSPRRSLPWRATVRYHSQSTTRQSLPLSSTCSPAQSQRPGMGGTARP